MGLVIVGFLCFCGVAGGDGVGAGLFVGVLVVGIAVMLRTLGAYRKAGAVCGRVEVENGRLTLWRPHCGKASWALPDCRWHLGKAREAEVFFLRLHLRRKMVIVECPVKVPIIGQFYERVPCGLTDEMRDVWEAFLTLGGIRKD